LAERSLKIVKIIQNPHCKLKKLEGTGTGDDLSPLSLNISPNNNVKEK